MRPAPELHEMFPPSRPDDTDSIQDVIASIAIMFFVIGCGAYLFGLVGS